MTILHSTDGLLIHPLLYVAVALLARQALEAYSPTREYFLCLVPYYRWGVSNRRDGVRRRASRHSM